MKDSSGRYWCVDCGTADQLKKGTLGEPCAGCQEPFPAAKLAKFGAARMCKQCISARTKGPGLFESLRGGGGGGDTAKTIKMLVVLALLAIVAAARYLKYF